MNKDLGKALYDTIHKDDVWPLLWIELSDEVKQQYRDAAFTFAAYVGKIVEAPTEGE